jgi:hypothetical protein
MQKLKLNKKIIIYISFYAILALDLAVVVPLQVYKIIRVKAQASDFKKKITFFERETALEVSLFDEKIRINKEITDKENKIASQGDTSAISVFLSNKAKETNFDAQEIILGKLQETKTVSTGGKFFYLPVRITGRAGFHNLAQFVNALETGPYSLQVKEFSIKEAKPYHIIDISLAALLRE